MTLKQVKQDVFVLLNAVYMHPVTWMWVYGVLWLISDWLN
jgi:hypothetical protein